MANMGKKLRMETFMPNDKADYYSGITSIIVNGKNAYELKGKFLDDLHNNAFSGTNRKDAVEHVEYYLKIIDPIKLPNVDHNKLRVVIFPISLVGGAQRWFDGIKESITCWVDLTANFFGKYYLPSRIEGNNTSMIKWDPANPRLEGWLATKFVNYKTMDIFTKGALWDYWKMGGDEIEVSNDESSDLEEYWSDKEETVYDKPWLDNGIWKEPKPVKHICKPFSYKTGCSEWPTCSCREDGYCNRGNLPGAYHIGKSLHYQDLEWYEALEDSELKDEALRNKAIMEGLISDDESSNDCWKRWKSHEIYYHNYDEGEYENETHEEGHELCGIETQDEYNDLTITSDEACRDYQEIFRMMDEGWMLTRTE
ncbi:hypothetical protein Tco_0407921 [Tanacetum coccineum]